MSNDRFDEEAAAIISAEFRTNRSDFAALLRAASAETARQIKEAIAEAVKQGLIVQETATVGSAHNCAKVAEGYRIAYFSKPYGWLLAHHPGNSVEIVACPFCGVKLS